MFHVRHVTFSILIAFILSSILAISTPFFAQAKTSSAAPINIKRIQATTIASIDPLASSTPPSQPVSVPASTTPSQPEAPSTNSGQATPPSLPSTSTLINNPSTDQTPTPTPTPNSSPQPKKSPAVTPSPTPLPTPSPSSTSTPLSTSSNSTATSTAGSITTQPPGSNQFSAADYYTPLDTLSSGATYGLAILAMILGIWGAVLIIREPGEQVLWTPRATSQPLVEP